MEDSNNLNLREGNMTRVNLDDLRAHMLIFMGDYAGADFVINRKATRGFINHSFETDNAWKSDASGLIEGDRIRISAMTSRSASVPNTSTTSLWKLPREVMMNPNDEGLTQSPSVSLIAHLPPHQSNVDVAAIFGVSLTTVGDLEVLIKDIDIGKHEGLLFEMNYDKRMIVFDALGAMCDLIEAQSTSNIPNDGLLYNIDDVAALFGVPLNSLKKIIEFTKDLKDTLLNMKKSSPIVDDSMSGKDSVSELIVQSLDINTKSTFYAGVAGASTKDQLTSNSNFRPLVADPVFDGVNISISCKVIKKGRSSFARCLIEVNSEADLMDVVTIGIPSLTGDGFTEETIRVDYEWRLPRCDTSKIFGDVHDHCPKKVVSPHIVTTSNVVTPSVKKTNDGFQTMGKKRKGKSKSTNGVQFVGPLVKQNVRYEPKAPTSEPKMGATNVGNASKSSSMLKSTGTSSKKGNIATSNSYSTLENEEAEETDEPVKKCV
uniref:Zinc knuckle CX2CX4HX4C n=1 Tax=Tanacetum cinerariifolium TaxID=118510 RepID=A0A699GW90_TANCI|nr:zinc knuckle CX2CX4HX4C [Tanacetum cinerariifolium]